MSRVRMDILPAGFGVSPKRSFERTGRAGTGDAGARNAMVAQLVGGAHAPRAHRLATRRTNEVPMAASWSTCACDRVRGEAPQIAREGAWAPQNERGIAS